MHVCVFWRGLNIAFFALPNPLSCSVMNKISLNQTHSVIVLTFGQQKVYGSCGCSLLASVYPLSVSTVSQLSCIALFSHVSLPESLLLEEPVLVSFLFKLSVLLLFMSSLLESLFSFAPLLFELLELTEALLSALVILKPLFEPLSKSFAFCSKLWSESILFDTFLPETLLESFVSFSLFGVVLLSCVFLSASLSLLL